AAAATAAATIAAPAAAATEPTAAAAAEAAAGTVLAGPGLIHDQRPPAHVVPVEGADGRVGLAGVAHLDETEAAGAAGLAVGDDRGVVHLAVLLEQGTKLLLVGAERQVS